MLKMNNIDAWKKLTLSVFSARVLYDTVSEKLGALEKNTNHRIIYTLNHAEELGTLCS